ncbi:uncharacterized protein LOC105165054 [Sesamum indicum]|uniref:Uncharacterized protein LOC105165054 n=1 Tax=Sesamum indicum TaxID=4182 RepID=A0A6I9TCD1_SESIN|nr:uncharacterized protein LOC105165054 [Sesamum indicum]
MKEITVKANEVETNLLSIMSADHHHHPLLRRAVSDVTHEISRLGKDLESIIELDETILEAECECCGLKEECTNEYISRIRNSYSGKWVCGLCSEAVKERLRQVVGIEEAMITHTNFVQDFNNTTRLNPKLSFTFAMRDIAKRSGQKRKILSGGMQNIIARSSSCVPRITTTAT